MEQEQRHLDIEGFTHTLEELSQVVDSLTHEEQRKASAASEGRHEELDGCIRREQALLMKLRGLESRRAGQAKALGWDSLTFRQILAQAGSWERGVLTPFFLELERLTDHFRLAHDAADRMILVRIRELQLFMEQSGVPAKSPSGAGKPLEGSSFHLQDKYV